mgnify:CR=1 FL=1
MRLLDRIQPAGTVLVAVTLWEQDGKPFEVECVGPWTYREWAEAYAKNHSSEWVDCEVYEITKP